MTEYPGPPPAGVQIAVALYTLTLFEAGSTLEQLAKKLGITDDEMLQVLNWAEENRA